MHTFKELQASYLNYLDQQSLIMEPTGLYEPVNYIMNLGGKRIRPILVLLSYNLFQDNVKYALPLAHAVEMFHNFSLVHDDIMDNAKLRRGKPTVHDKYNLNTGILSGDVMMIKTYEYLTGLNSDRTLEIIAVFNLVARKICEGQQMDMDFEIRNDVKISEYILMIKYKTAILLAGALKMGAILGNASADQCDLLWNYGINIGLAFQLQDDILDVYGDPKTFGKKVGGDIIQNKKTFLMLSLLEHMSFEDRKLFENILDLENEDEKISQVRRLYDNYEIKKLADIEMNHYYLKAENTFKLLKIQPQKSKSEIENLSRKLMNRIS